MDKEDRHDRRRIPLQHLSDRGVNRQPGTGHSKRQFALLLVGLAAVALLLYAQIVWYTAVAGRGGWAAAEHPARTQQRWELSQLE